MNKRGNEKYSDLTIKEYYMSQVIMGLYSSGAYKTKSFAEMARMANLQSEYLLSTLKSKDSEKK